MIVDENGSVWSAGANGQGQLGVGDTTSRNQFSKIDRLPKLSMEAAIKAHGRISIEKASEERVGEIFKQVREQQNKELKDKLIEVIPTAGKEGIMQEAEIVEQMVRGVIPLADWSIQWTRIHQRNQELQHWIEEKEITLLEKQKAVSELQDQIKELTRSVSEWKEEKETVDFFDKFLAPIVSVEKQLTASFQLKLENVEAFTVDDVSLFLSVCGMQDSVPFQREQQYDGEHLKTCCLLSDAAGMGIKDTLTSKRFEFYGKIVESGLFGKEEVLSQSVVWRHLEIGATLKLLKEWEIQLDAELVKEKQISICQLIFFKIEDFEKIFGMTKIEIPPLMKKLQTVRKQFEKLLEENRVEEQD